MLAFEEPSAQLCVVALLSLCNNALLPSTPPSLGTCPGGDNRGGCLAVAVMLASTVFLTGLKAAGMCLEVVQNWGCLSC